MKTTEQALEYHIEKLSQNNLADAERLHTAVYGVIPPRNFFSMKYDTAFMGVKHVGYIAYNKQRAPVAFYAVIPCFIQFKDKTVLAAQSADTMTHPEYRNKDLFVALAQMTFSLCSELGIHLVFGFPNQNSLPGFVNKLGWIMTERMECFVINSGLSPWGKLLNKIAPLKNKLAASRQNVLKNYLLNQQGIINSALSDGFAGVLRDTSFLKYKTYNDTYVIKIGYSILWIKVGGVLLIGDISLGPHEFNDVMYHLKNLASKLGIKEIHFHASPGTTLHGLFAKNYKPAPSFPIIFKDLGEGGRMEQIKFTSADIDTF